MYLQNSSTYDLEILYVKSTVSYLCFKNRGEKKQKSFFFLKSEIFSFFIAEFYFSYCTFLFQGERSEQPPEDFVKRIVGTYI